MVQIITKRFKRKSSPKKSNNMAKNKRKSSRRSRVKSVARRVAKRMPKRRRNSNVGGKGTLFDGKILGQKIPLISKFIGNRNVQKAMVGAGTVAVVGGLVSLANQPVITNLWNKTPVRVGAAIATGDIIGGATVLALENPNILNTVRGQVGQVAQVGTQAGQQQALVQQAGFA